ncbi:hypothetical protein PRNP1_007072 [Phytophthora ramorum]
MDEHLTEAKAMGVNSANDSINTNFLYSKRKEEKGPNELISLLHRMPELHYTFQAMDKAMSSQVPARKRAKENNQDEGKRTSV